MEARTSERLYNRDQVTFSSNSIFYFRFSLWSQTFGSHVSFLASTESWLSVLRMCSTVSVLFLLTHSETFFFFTHQS